MADLTDAQVLDRIAEILRTPEWGAWTIEDVAEEMEKVRDIDSLNRHTHDGLDRLDPQTRKDMGWGDWPVGIVPGQDRRRH